MTTRLSSKASQALRVAMTAAGRLHTNPQLIEHDLETLTFVFHGGLNLNIQMGPNGHPDIWVPTCIRTVDSEGRLNRMWMGEALRNLLEPKSQRTCVLV